VVVTTGQRIEIRGLVSELAQIKVTSGEESAGVAAFLQAMSALAARAGGAAPCPAPPDTAIVKQLTQVTGNEQLTALLAAKDNVKAAWKDWAGREKAIAQRLPRWERTRQLVRHARHLPIGFELASQLDAVEAQRSLLDDPDPVLPMVKDLEEALRVELKKEKSAFDEARKNGMAELSGDATFGQLPEARRQAIVAECGLSAVDMPKVDTDESLVRVLDEASLPQWADRTAGLESRFERARKIAAAELEPATVTVHAPKAMLKTKDDVDDYVEKLRQDMLVQIEAGHPVVI
jgi:hypothetical protein